MRTLRGLPRSTFETAAAYGAVSLLPVLMLGVVLAGNYRSDAQRRGVAEGRSEAAIVAQTAVEPLLPDHPLSTQLPDAERRQLEDLVSSAVASHHVLRLRLRDLDGRVVFSDDRSGFSDRPEDEALDAAKGEVVARLTHLNTDRNDSGPTGSTAVEVYMPLVSGPSADRVGVLEIYVPYAPIAHDVSAGLHRLYLDLTVGLALLWVVLAGISFSLSRGLRRQVRLNAYMAEHDVLTDLPNRVLFHRRAEIAVRGACRRGARAAIAIIDLDRFKEVNDTLGHHSGDQLLSQLARRLAGSMGATDTVARLGGDEFGVILGNLHNPEVTLRGLRAVIDEQLEVNGLPLSVEASIGFVIAPDDGEDVDQLLQRADVAMYMAKAQHAGVVRYDARHDHYDATNLALVGELRQAIDSGRLVLHYQPKESLRSGTVDALEALVRWDHPTLGLLYPDRFLPLAEQTDLIDRLTDWVLDRALADLAALGPSAAGVSIAVNVSARNLASSSFSAHVSAALASHDISPTRLILEITETALLADPQRAAVLLGDLASTGVRISIDDFGRGHTSLGYLSALTVHELKIDKSFVTDMLVDRAHEAIVRSVVDLGHNLSMRVVAEGVDNDATLAGVREAGCDVVQGFLIGRPMALDQLDRWLAGRRVKDTGRIRRQQLAPAP